MNISETGGAAAKAKALKEKMERDMREKEERQSWFDAADKTEETGVMRLVIFFFENNELGFKLIKTQLIESQVLLKHKVSTDLCGHEYLAPNRGIPCR